MNCAKKNAKSADFSGICKIENQETVEIQGFLHLQGDSKSNQFLLVENKNGTGGFIKVLFEKNAVAETLGEVKIVGKVLKGENSCVLKIEKIETP